MESKEDTPSTTGSTNDNNDVLQWDLTWKIAPYLDRHMMFPLLEFIDTLVDDDTKYTTYKKNDVAVARLALLRPTNMVDYAMDVYKSVHDGDDSTTTTIIPKEMLQQKDHVYKKLEELRNGCIPLTKLMNDHDKKDKLLTSGQWNVAGLIKHTANDLPENQITYEMIEIYRRLGRCNFDCGDYESSRDILVNYLSLYAKAPLNTKSTEDEDDVLAGLHQHHHHQQQNQQQDTKDLGNPSMYYLTTINTRLLQVLWGRLACEILLENYDNAAIGIDAVKVAIELLVSQQYSQQLTALQALQQRTWLLHWSLFVYWNETSPKASVEKTNLEQLVDLFQNTERYKQAITTNAPHLLRYLTAAVLLCKRRVTQKNNKDNNSQTTISAATNAAEARRLLKNLVAVMQDCEYTDPIVEFVNCLCVKFDFDNAQLKLNECKSVLESDFFLCQQTSIFMEEARVFVFENYCRIHNKIDLKALGEKLAMNIVDAERWIVDLILHAGHLLDDAKIDSTSSSSGDPNNEGKCVVMGMNTQSMHEHVMERTRDLNLRTATLTSNLNTMLVQAKKERMKQKKLQMEREQDY